MKKNLLILVVIVLIISLFSKYGFGEMRTYASAWKKGIMSVFNGSAKIKVADNKQNLKEPSVDQKSINKLPSFMGDVEGLTYQDISINITPDPDRFEDMGSDDQRVILAMVEPYYKEEISSHIKTQENIAEKAKVITDSGSYQNSDQKSGAIFGQLYTKLFDEKLNSDLKDPPLLLEEIDPEDEDNHVFDQDSGGDNLAVGYENEGDDNGLLVVGEGADCGLYFHYVNNMLFCSMDNFAGPAGDGSPTADSSAPSCGDGFIGNGESCDDGNNFNGDGCTASCQIEEGLEDYGYQANSSDGNPEDDGEQVFYVSNDGDDAGNGMVDEPFKTFTMAVNSARRLNSQHVVILLKRGGSFSLSEYDFKNFRNIVIADYGSDERENKKPVVTIKDLNFSEQNYLLFSGIEIKAESLRVQGSHFEIAASELYINNIEVEVDTFEVIRSLLASDVAVLRAQEQLMIKGSVITKISDDCPLCDVVASKRQEPGYRVSFAREENDLSKSDEVLQKSLQIEAKDVEFSFNVVKNVSAVIKSDKIIFNNIIVEDNDKSDNIELGSILREGIVRSIKTP